MAGISMKTHQPVSSQGFKLAIFVCSLLFAACVQAGIEANEVTSNPSTTDVNADNLHRLLELKHQGRELWPNDTKVRLFIGVLSAASNHHQRMAVRESWCQEPSILSGEVVVRFFVAQTDDELVLRQINLEQEIHRDLVSLNFTDGYYEITKKTKAILEMMVHNTSARYALKCDDDSYLFLARILQELDKLDAVQPPLPYVYMGRISRGNEPNRNPNGKWFMSRDDYPGAEYPPFAHGPGYILSRALAEIFLGMWADPEESAHLPLLRLEDISVAVWVDHARRQHNVSVEYRHDSRFLSEGCDENCLVGHYITPERMVCIWNRYSTQQPRHCC